MKNIIKSLLILCRKLKLIIFYHNRIGHGVEVTKSVYLTHCIIGKYSYLGMYSFLNHVKMGNYCSIAANVTIGAMEHDYYGISTSTHINKNGSFDKYTTIGNDVWIGTQCVVRQGVTIGDGAVIGANSFVNKDIPPYAIVFGTPARVYKYRFDAKKIAEIEASHYWDFDPVAAVKLLEESSLR